MSDLIETPSRPTHLNINDEVLIPGYMVPQLRARRVPAGGKGHSRYDEYTSLSHELLVYNIKVSISIPELHKLINDFMSMEPDHERD